MQSIASRSSEIAWLSARLANRRNNILDLVQRLSSLGPAAGQNPAIYGKFLRMLDEVAGAKDEEAQLLAWIETIEDQHRFQRKGKKLKRGGPRRKKADIQRIYDQDSEIEPKRPAVSLLWLIVLWYLFLRDE